MLRLLMARLGSIQQQAIRVQFAEAGQTMVEYALIAALISIVAITIIIVLGPSLDDLFADVVNAVKGI